MPVRGAAGEVVAVLERVCRERGCRLYLGGRDWRWRTEEDGSLTVEGWFGSVEALRPTLQGEHQQQNAACAVAVALLLAASHGWEVGDEAVARGLNGVVWPGRLELLRRRPAVVVDGAHNGDSAQRLAQALRSRDWRYRRLWLVLGLSGDKDADAILAPLAPLASRVIATRSHHPRSLAVEQLAERCRGYGAVVSTSVSVADALAQAIARADEADLICATGSLFVVAEAREALGRG